MRPYLTSARSCAPCTRGPWVVMKSALTLSETSSRSSGRSIAQRRRCSAQRTDRARIALSRCRNGGDGSDRRRIRLSVPGGARTLLRLRSDLRLSGIPCHGLFALGGGISSARVVRYSPGAKNRREEDSCRRGGSAQRPRRGAGSGPGVAGDGLEERRARPICCESKSLGRRTGHRRGSSARRFRSATARRTDRRRGAAAVGRLDGASPQLRRSPRPPRWRLQARWRDAQEAWAEERAIAARCTTHLSGDARLARAVRTVPRREGSTSSTAAVPGRQHAQRVRSGR